jgi:hypothetical protein
MAGFTKGGKGQDLGVWFNPTNVHLTDPMARARITSPTQAQRTSDFSKNVQDLTARLSSLIDTYGQSESVADRELANIYAGYLRELGKGGTFARKVIKQYQAGYIPGLGRSGGETAPAWS